MYTRYNRQIILPNFGTQGQEKLLSAKVLVVGAGGLGCPVLQCLAAAGVGNIGIVDFDTVDISNLQRQSLFTEHEVGQFKVIAAKRRLQQINSEIKIVALTQKLTNKNILPILEGYDIVVDCTDNFQVRYMLNDACALQNKPLVYAAIYRYEGQVSVFNIGDEKLNYRDLFPTPPQPDEVPNCNEAGVLGTLSGMIGTIQANETIKIITGVGKVLAGKLLTINTLDYTTHTFRYQKSQKNQAPESIEEFLNTDYNEVCGFSSSNQINNLTQLENLLKKENTILIDVRNEDELPKVEGMPYIQIPLSELSSKLDELTAYTTIIFLCQSGVRSAKAVQLMKDQYPNKDIYNITNGIKTITN